MLAEIKEKDKIQTIYYVYCRSLEESALLKIGDMLAWGIRNKN